MAAPDCELVAQHDDLDVVGASGANGEVGEGGDETVENSRHSRPASAAFALVNTRSRTFGPHRLRMLRGRGSAQPARSLQSGERVSGLSRLHR